MAAARAMAFANKRTRLIVRLLESAPPLWESHRYAIAQALSETRLQAMSTPPGASSTGGVAPLAGGEEQPTALDAAWDAYQAERARAGLRTYGRRV